MMKTDAFPQRTFLLLAGLGFAAGAWAIFLWWQLLRARAGFEPICLGDAGGCGALWDGGLATWVQARTGLPIAAWGLVWGIAATSLPLRALSKRDPEAPGVAWTAAAGLLGIAGLLAASAAAGQFCGSCALTYVLTGLYGAVALRTLGLPSLGSGLATFAVATALSWLVLLYPGSRTPKNLESEGRAALQNPGASPAETEAAAASQPDDRDHNHDHDHEHPPIVLPVVAEDHPLRIADWPLPADEQERRLREFLAGLDARLQQAIADLLAEHRASPVHALAPPRDLHGAADAGTRIVDFTDTLCGHCAQLFVDLAFLRQLFPASALSVDSRQYPLDGNCNRHLPVRGPEQVRCLAARARICFEGHPGKEDFELALYEDQHGLSEEQVYEAARPFFSRSELQACVSSGDTARKLASDVDDAARYSPSGTPLVLVGGRQSASFGPLLYALVLAGGDAGHPAFSLLPPPSS